MPSTTTTNHIAFTSPINPPNSSHSPPLTRRQIWRGLQHKIISAESYVPAAISSTTVISESTDPQSGNLVTVRDVTFKDGNKKVRETVTAFEDCWVEFKQADGSTVRNVVSEGERGELYMTYVFEWRHPGVDGEELAKLKDKEKKMAKMAVEGTIEAMRKLAQEGKLGE